MKLALLKDKNFALLIMGKFVSMLGSRMQHFALSLYVLALTGSATLFGSVLAVGILPRIILGPFVGVFVDWFDRKKIIVCLDIINGIIVGIFAIIYHYNGGFNLSQIYTLVILLTLTSLMFGPAISTVIPTILHKDDLVEGNSINSLVFHFACIVAPAIGGILMGTHGLFVILIINAVSFILSGISEMFLKIPPVEKKKSTMNLKGFLCDFKEGVMFIRQKKILITLIAVTCIINFAFTPLTELGITFISKNIIKVSDVQFGILETVMVLGALISPFLLTRFTKKMRIGQVLYYGIMIIATLAIAFAFVSTDTFLGLFGSNTVPYISFMAVIFIIELFFVSIGIALDTLVQREIPMELYGRVLTVLMTVSTSMQPIGKLLFGALFDNLDSWIVVSIGIVMTYLVMTFFRKILCQDDSEKDVKTATA